jgi:AraC-like DNA-binding protein
LSTGAQFPNSVGQIDWNPNLDKILKAGATAPSKLQRAVQRIREQNPELNLKQILRRTAELGLSSWKNNWTEEEKTFVLDHAREFSVADIARRLGRTPRAVYQLLWRSGESAKFQDGYTQCQLAQELHVSPRKVRQWVRLGWLILYQGRVKDRSLQRFLDEHSGEVDTTRLDRDLLVWLRELGLREGATHTRRWLSTRQQSLKEHVCGRCGRKVHGNAFHRHTRACAKKVCSPARGLVECRLN